MIQVVLKIHHVKFSTKVPLLPQRQFLMSDMFPCVSVWPANGSRAGMDGDLAVVDPLMKLLGMVKKHHNQPEERPVEKHGAFLRRPTSKSAFRVSHGSPSPALAHLAPHPSGVPPKPSPSAGPSGGLGRPSVASAVWRAAWLRSDPGALWLQNRSSAAVRWAGRGSFWRIGGAWKVCLVFVELGWFGVV